MNRLAYLTAMALLGIGLTMAQNTKPSSNPSNSSNSSAQTQTSSPGTVESGQTPATSPQHHHTAAADSEGVPNTTVEDQQNSTTSTTGVSGQSATQPSTSTMGTTGSTATSPDSNEPANKGATVPRNDTPVDQQPNSSTSPSAPPPHAALMPGPAARAVATHTPDPGTCMNPAALDATQNGTDKNLTSPCR